MYSFLAIGLMVVFKRLASLLHIRTVPISKPSYPDLRFSWLSSLIHLSK